MELALFIIVLFFAVLYFQQKKELTKINSENKELKNKIENLLSLNDRQKILTTIDEPSIYKTVNKVVSEKRSRENYAAVTQEDLLYFMKKKIDKEYLFPKKDLESTSHFFCGKKCVITGDFSSFSSRNEMAKLLWEVGADVDLSVGKNTRIVIVGDNPGHSKLIQAEDLGLEFITENEFINYFKI